MPSDPNTDPNNPLYKATHVDPNQLNSNQWGPWKEQKDHALSYGGAAGDGTTADDSGYGGVSGGLYSREAELRGYGDAMQGGAVDPNYDLANEAYGDYRANAGRQQENADYLHSVMMGEAGPSAAERQMQAGTQQSMAAQLGMGHGGAAAGRNAEIANAGLGAQNVQGAQIMRAGEQATARGQYAQEVARLARQDLAARQQAAQMAQFGGSLEMQRRMQNNDARSQMEQLRNQAGIAQLGAKSGQLGLVTRLSQEQRQANRHRYDAMTAGALNAGGAALTMGAYQHAGDQTVAAYNAAEKPGETSVDNSYSTSDARAKRNIQRLDGNVFDGDDYE